MSENANPASANSLSDLRAIAHYHAHIYYDPAVSKERANRLRESVAKRFPQARIGH